MTSHAESMVSELRGQLSDHLSRLQLAHGNEIHLELRLESLNWLPKVCNLVSHQWHASFLCAWTSDERVRDGVFRLHYAFALLKHDIFVVVSAAVPAEKPEFPSVAAQMIAANWAEREIRDTFGLIPIGHPNLKRLWAHPDWPTDAFAMRKDFQLNAQPPRVSGEFEFHKVEGEGVFEIPVGPVHAGVIEPGHFRFSVAGEPIINLQLQLFYTHKGTEKLCEGLSPERVLHISERISGDSSFAHSAVFCHAVERLASVEIPERAAYLRMLFLELERIYNHLSDIGMIANDVAFAFGYAQAMCLREAVMVLNEKITGSRLLRGMNRLGGVGRDLSDATFPSIHVTLQTVREGLKELAALLFDSASVLDRLETTGVLAHKTAQDVGIVGVAARASGIDRDFRRDHPHLLYNCVAFKAPTYTGGDVYARTRVRVDEVFESIQIIEQILNQIPAGPIQVSLEKLPADALALGYTEGWRGPIVHALQTDVQGRISRYKIDDPSFHNWPALVFAVQGNIVPDFPLINKSFNLSYSGNDR
jgi:Ni,Fe-hydrogenase III large subunit/Ni,Fe-hydrogenase III component G